LRTAKTFPLVVVLASAQIGALALDNLRREVVQDVMLDIDRDGRMDRAVLVRQADDSYVDLWVISELKTSLSTCLAVPIL